MPIGHTLKKGIGVTNGRVLHISASWDAIRDVAWGDTPGRMETRVNLTRSPDGDAEPLLGVSERRVEHFGDRTRCEFVEVAKAEDVAISGPQQRQDSSDHELSLNAFNTDVRRRLSILRQCSMLEVVSPDPVPPVPPAQVAHRGHEPCLRVLDARVSREEGNHRFLQKSLGIGVRYAELAGGDIEQQAPVLPIQTLRLVGWMNRRNGRRR